MFANNRKALAIGAGVVVVAGLAAIGWARRYQNPAILDLFGLQIQKPAAATLPAPRRIIRPMRCTRTPAMLRGTRAPASAVNSSS